MEMPLPNRKSNFMIVIPEHFQRRREVMELFDIAGEVGLFPVEDALHIEWTIAGAVSQAERGGHRELRHKDLKKRLWEVARRRSP